MSVFLLVAIVAASLTTSTCAANDTNQPPVAGGKQPSIPAAEFLRARCDTTGIFSNYCYNSLLPHADNLHGSDVKLIRIATAILVGRIRASLREMRHANSTGTDLMIGGQHECIEKIEEATHGDREALASLRRLEASSNGAKLSGRDLDDAKNWIDKAEIKINQCFMILANDDTIGQKLPVTDTHLAQSKSVVVHLFEEITK